MKLEYSYIKDCSEYKKFDNQIDKGLGIYTGIVHKGWVPEYIKPDITEYTKRFYVKDQYPGYTRVGNSTLDC